jgi:hypothetical protein
LTPSPRCRRGAPLATPESECFHPPHQPARRPLVCHAKHQCKTEKAPAGRRQMSADAAGAKEQNPRSSVPPTSDSIPHCSGGEKLVSPARRRVLNNGSRRLKCRDGRPDCMKDKASRVKGRLLAGTAEDQGVHTGSNGRPAAGRDYLLSLPGSRGRNAAEPFRWSPSSGRDVRRLAKRHRPNPPSEAGFEINRASASRPLKFTSPPFSGLEPTSRPPRLPLGTREIPRTVPRPQSRSSEHATNRKSIHHI